MKKDYTYLTTLNWDELQRWAKYATDSEVNWRDLVRVIIEKADSKIEDAYDAGRGDGHDGYHHWDS